MTTESRAEELGMEGIVEAVLRDRQGRPLDRRRTKNLITSAGRRLLAEALFGRAGEVTLEIAVGSGKSPPRVDDRALVAMLGRSRVREPAVVDVEGGRVRVVLRAEIPEVAGAEAQEIREAGLLVSVDGGPPVLFNRALFPALTRTAGVDLDLSWEITI